MKYRGMKKEHHIVMIPGLNDQNVLQKKAMNFIPRLWRCFGVFGHIVEPHWEERDTFKPKLYLIIAQIDELVDQGHDVSILGLSAGGSAALNAFASRKNVLSGCVNGTGRLRKGKHVRPSLEWASRNSPAFRESVLLFEHTNEQTLTKNDRRRIMTLRPFWDEIVPSSTVTVENADNRILPVIGHMLGGVYTCIFYAKEIVNFLNNQRL